jgi:hypothetical protein
MLTKHGLSLLLTLGKESQHLLLKFYHGSNVEKLATGQPFYLDLILKLKLKKANMSDHGLNVTAFC